MGRAAVKFATNRLQYGQSINRIKRFEFIESRGLGYVAHVWLVSGEFFCCVTIQDVVELVG